MQNLPEITNQLTSKDLFAAFKQQLAKDFAQSNFSTSFVEHLEPDYNSIHKKIASELQRHEASTDFNLMHLLYRIDISETQLKRYLNAHKNQSYHQVIAELVIKRVLQKVVVKRYYKNKENWGHSACSIFATNSSYQASPYLRISGSFKNLYKGTCRDLPNTQAAEQMSHLW